MKIVVCIIALGFGLLSAVAPFAQIKAGEKRIANFIMLCGGILLMTAAILKWNQVHLSIFVAALAALLICGSAIWNGIKNGKVHISHHFIRITISTIIIILFAFF